MDGIGNSYSAQEEHLGGGLRTESEAGGDALHGTAFLTLQSSALAAVNPLAIASSYADGVVTSGPVKPHDLRENYGITLGGPVPGTARVRFFYAFDQQRRGFPAVSSPSDPNFYRLTAVQTGLLATRGVGRAAVNGALNYLSSLTGRLRDERTRRSTSGGSTGGPPGEVDLTAEYNGVKWGSPAGLIDAPVVARGRASLGNASGSLDQAIVHVVARGGRHLENIATVQFVRDLQFESPQTPLAQEPGIAPGGLARR